MSSQSDPPPPLYPKSLDSAIAPSQHPMDGICAVCDGTGKLAFGQECHGCEGTGWNVARTPAKLTGNSIAKVIYCTVTAYLFAFMLAARASGYWNMGRQVNALICGVSVVVLLFTPYFSWRFQHRDEGRKRALRRTSRKYGLGLDQFYLTTVGLAPLLSGLKRGTRHGTKFAVFEYTHCLVEGDVGQNHSKPVCQTVAWLYRPGTQLLEFAVSPDSYWKKVNTDILELFSRPRDIDFKSHPTFSKNYRLCGDDEGAIRRLFTTDLLNFYEQHPGLCTEVAGNKLLYYYSARHIDSADIQNFLKEAFRLLELIFSPQGACNSRTTNTTPSDRS